MAIILETGTGVVGANSYVSLEEASDYFAMLGVFDWYDSEPALLNATQSVDLLYGARFLGTPLTATQSLLFPRVSFTDRNGFTRSGIPSELKKAVFELAYQYLKNGSAALVQNASADTQLKKVRVKLDTMEEEKEYFGATTTSPSLNRKVDLLLAPILRGRANGQVRIVRA
jgi:hypothetical protein